jgi:hypothetical protein
MVQKRRRCSQVQNIKQEIKGTAEVVTKSAFDTRLDSTAIASFTINTTSLTLAASGTVARVDRCFRHWQCWPSHVSIWPFHTRSTSQDWTQCCTGRRSSLSRECPLVDGAPKECARDCKSRTLSASGADFTNLLRRSPTRHVFEHALCICAFGVGRSEYLAMFCTCSAY